jgi:hypothetical protein
MYSQFFFKPEQVFIDHQRNFQKCIIAGNWLMVISALIVSSCISITFAFDDNFSIVSQVAAHISTIIFAGFLKIGYVLRCIGIHGLGFKLF